MKFLLRCWEAGRIGGSGWRSSGPSVHGFSSLSVLVFAALLATPFSLSRDNPKREARVWRRLLFPSVTNEQEQLLQPQPVATPSGGKAGVAPGRDGTTPQRPLQAESRGGTWVTTVAQIPRADIRRTRDAGLAHNAGSPTAKGSHDPSPSQKSLRKHSIENKGGCGL